MMFAAEKIGFVKETDFTQHIKWFAIT